MKRFLRGGGFSLVELLVVMAVISILAALLLPALGRAKERGRSASCVNQLRQIGFGLHMYVQDNGWYPPLAEKGSTQTCFDFLYPYDRRSWTNDSWNCPSYVAGHGIVSRDRVLVHSSGISYSYNHMGILPGWPGSRKFKIELGLGLLPKNCKKEPQIAAPSQMYAVADARSETVVGERVAGYIKAFPWKFPEEAPPSHGRGYNVLFCDGHVASVKRSVYLHPPRSAAHWNSDNQPHPEVWAPKNLWAVQE